MKDHFNAMLDAAKTAGNTLREKAANAGQAAMDNTVSAIEKWLEEFPKISSYGLDVSNFAFTMGLSPSLEVELKGAHSDFPPDRLTQIIGENKTGSLTGMIFTAVRTTYKLHRKIAPKPEELLIVKIKLALSPEIMVVIGRPRVN